MSDAVRSVVVGTSGLALALLGALLLTVSRGTGDRADPEVRDRVVRLLLVGVACQCAHFTEEYLTRFHERLHSSGSRRGRAISS